MLALTSMARPTTCKRICQTFTFIGTGWKVFPNKATPIHGLTQMEAQDFTHILIPPFFINVKYNARLESQPSTLIVLYICFSKEVTRRRSRVCGITTLESKLQMTGVWCNILDKSYSVTAQRIMLLKKEIC